MSNNEPAAAEAPVVIEIWSDIACPWCYIGKRRFARALEQFEGRDRVQVVWRAFQLAPDTPAGLGRNELEALVEHKGMAPDQVRAMFSHVASTAAADGLELDFDTVIAANTFDAHRLVHLAGDRADDVVDALFRAHFTEGRTIDDRDELVAVAASAGLDAGAVRSALDSEAGAEQVRADLEQARALGVTGVPFFVANRSLAVSGAQPVEVFTQLLDRAQATADTATTDTATADESAPSCEDGSCAV